MSTFTTIYRLLVMVGTLAVAWMAWQLYGPPPEKVRPVWNRVVEVVREAMQSEPASPEEPYASHPFEGEPLEGLDPLLEPLSPRPFPSDQAIQPIAHWQDAPPDLVPETQQPGEQAAGPTSVPEVVQRLRQLGIADYSLAPWGTSGDIYRFRCAAPWGSEGAFHRHFEAVAANPADAALRVLSQVEAWQQTEASRATSDTHLR